MNIEALNL